ncbi:hypothetical protein CYMTET_29985 [Cymbomonas tetramitiformis]|uniref:C2 domain-containing protein n=1 Tax=Cymbomonas tetramitiformis TaxID=36881 RepID=A0AAE0KUL7_9CHLO|nr:hypothetical protein CYMTET_29985 [Cymbomonas tetramitiformis]
MRATSTAASLRLRAGYNAILAPQAARGWGGHDLPPIPSGGQLVDSAQDLTSNRSLTETYERFVSIELSRQMGEIIGQKKTKGRTAENPAWNEEHFFIIDNFEREEESAKVTFQVYNQNIIQGDVFLGSLEFSLSEIAKSKRMHSAFPLQNIDQGALRVEVSLFYWDGPVITSAGNYNLMKKERQQREKKSGVWR